MYSPYSKVMANDPSVPAIEGLRGGVRVGGRTKMSDGPAFGANGELNATTKRELMQVMAQVLHQAQSNVITRPTQTVEDANMRLAALVEAYNDRSGNQFQVLGEVISEELWETLGREGFSRKLFAVSPVAQGQMGRVKVRRKDVVAYQITTDVKVQEQRIRQTWI